VSVPIEKIPFRVQWVSVFVQQQYSNQDAPPFPGPKNVVDGG